MEKQLPTVKAVFDHVLELESAAQRTAYLDEVCGEFPEVRVKVEALLKAYGDAGSFLESPAKSPADSQDLSPTKDLKSANSDDKDIGTLISGRYKLLERIGEGGMGAVYMAEQTSPVRRLVAVKLIKRGMDSSGVLARFEAERQALALMDHPNIAKVLDAGATDDGRPFFVMELVRGVPITRYCDECRLAPRQRLELFALVCHALQHAHQKGVIHRDVKPSNVLVALYDGKPVPKVIDFGVAKATGQPLTDRTLHTGFGAIVGTPEYMSPEQATINQLDIDTRSDVYSLGVLLYELLTGTTPVSAQQFGKAAVLEILRVVREEDPPRPSVKLSTTQARASVAATRGTEPDKLANMLKGELDWIAMKALAKDRDRRYDSASLLARDVERYLNDEMVEARPPSIGYRLKKFYRKQRGTVWAVAIVMLALTAGIVGTLFGMANAVRAEMLAVQARVEAEHAMSMAISNEEKSRAAIQFLEDDAMSLLFAARSPNPKTFWRELARTLSNADKLAARYEGQPLVEARIRQAILFGQYLLASQNQADQKADYSDALRNAQRISEIMAREHGDDHDETYEALVMLGACQTRMKQIPEAERSFAKVVDGFERQAKGDDWHATLMNAADGLAHVWLKQGRGDRVAPLFQRLIERSRRYHKDKPQELATALDDMANQWLSWTDLDIEASDLVHAIAAERALRESLAIRRQQSSDDWTTYRTQSMLGAALMGQKQYTEAEPLLRDGYEGLKERAAKIPAAQANAVRDAGQRLATLYEATNRLEQAKLLRQKIAESSKGK